MASSLPIITIIVKVLQNLDLPTIVFKPNIFDNYIYNTLSNIEDDI